MAVDLISNIFEYLNSFSETDEEFYSKHLVRCLRIASLTLIFIGFVVNYFSFETTFHLKKSINVTLMRCLSVWDSLILVEAGIFITGNKLLHINDFISTNVSLLQKSYYSNMFSSIFFCNFRSSFGCL